MQSSIDRACMELAASQHWLITRRQVLELGLSPQAVDRRLASGDFVRVYNCIYCIAPAPESWQQQLLGACLWTRGCASHRSALMLLGIDGYSGAIVEVTSAGAKRTSTDTVRFHHKRLSSSDVMRVGAIPVTTATRTLVDVGSVLSEKGLEEALDSALRQRLTTIDRLRAGVESLGGRGSRGPAALGKLLDARGDVVATDSALETHFSRLLRRYHLPQPQRQVEVRNGQAFVGRVDFAYPELKIAIEIQSHRWHSSRAAQDKDRERLTRLQLLGWIVVQVTYEDLVRHPDEVAARVRAAIELRRARRASI